MKAFSVAALAASVLQAPIATADEIRHLTFPAALLGTWAQTEQQCASKDPSNVTIEKAKYSDSTGSCAVRWIVETAGSQGPNYAAHALCTSSVNPSQTETVNIIIRPAADGRATMGRSFNALETYQRCPAG